MARRLELKTLRDDVVRVLKPECSQAAVHGGKSDESASMLAGEYVDLGDDLFGEGKELGHGMLGR